MLQVVLELQNTLVARQLLAIRLAENQAAAELLAPMALVALAGRIPQVLALVVADLMEAMPGLLLAVVAMDMEMGSRSPEAGRLMGMQEPRERAVAAVAVVLVLLAALEQQAAYGYKLLMALLLAREVEEAALEARPQ